ncbi:MAG TPA: prefoldin subunit beta [Methanofastidiosum sp.]|nr:prefoldin subunit beta [Methanofastidiosum sp.]HOC78241.1 prefoldin subunit beta [Methanofastidiosum sp.]HOG74306.1 prefoldin subunit beta [Methanofastidiosum sp.]HPA49744.1 prefoldin subunit beta [Methanofastidiosum sp.]HQK63189.1 prefoldin subunit beta [Methanofastidiosum sp.]
MQNIPENIQQELMQFQQLQSQYQIIVSQLQSLKIEMSETDAALNELSKTENPVVYKSIGSILIKSEKPDLLEDLNKKKESIDIRIKTIEKQEDRVKKKLEEMQKNLQKALGGQPSSG